MVKSMTGYGKAQSVTDLGEISVEVKSVNNRYADINIRLPKFLNFAEDKIKKIISEYTSRGKIDMFISIVTAESSGKKVVIDKDLAYSYIDAFRQFCQEADIKFDISASRLMSSDVVTVEHEERSDEEVWAFLEPVVREAMEAHTEARCVEGEKLKKDLIEKAELIKSNVAEIEKIVPDNIESYRERLLQKINEVLENYELEENRLVAEVAVYTDKVCVDEEIVRLKSHLTEVASILNSDGPVGKKLDFIIQEMNREINTIGSKSNELKITRLVVDTKTEIEKIREQIQNLE